MKAAGKDSRFSVLFGSTLIFVCPIQSSSDDADLTEALKEATPPPDVISPIPSPETLDSSDDEIYFVSILYFLK